jgi:signal transduction histidine kinase
VDKPKRSAIDTTLRSWVTAGFALAMAVTILMGFLSWRSAERATEYYAWVAHTESVKAQLQAILGDATDIETGARGFDITGQEAFLAPEKEQRRAIDDGLQRITDLTADNPSQQARAQLLRSQVASKVDQSFSMIATRRRTSAVSEPDVFLESKLRMEAVRETVSEMQAEEDILLGQRKLKVKEALQWTRIVTSSGTLVGLVLLLAAAIAIRHQIDTGGRMRLQLAELNADLEDRVEERATALQARSEELVRSEGEVRTLNSELEQRVRARTAELEAINKELEAFTYSVSHDLRAPLRHIAGFSNLLLDEYNSSLAPPAQHYLERIQQGTRRMGLLVDDFLKLARVGRQELSLQLIGLDTIVRDVISNLKSETEGRLIEWKIGKLPYVEGDAALLKQVFENLLSNALKYSRPRAQTLIEIGQETSGGDTNIFVRDNGVASA